MSRKSSQRVGEPLIVWTIGHSTHSWEEFLALLEANRIELIADVRKLPGSRRHPQFNQAELAEALSEAGIEYRHFPGLGGRRPVRREAPVHTIGHEPQTAPVDNSAWRNASFRNFADYMQTAEFAAALAELVAAARERRAALMCAEAVPWRCHRSLIADALIAQSIQVEDILTRTKTEHHALRPWAKIDAGLVSYPAAPAGTDEPTPEAGSEPQRRLFPK